MLVSTNMSLVMTAGSGEGGKGRRGESRRKRQERKQAQAEQRQGQGVQEGPVSSPGQRARVRVKGTSPVHLRQVWSKGQGRPRPSRGEVDQVQRQRREALTPCVGYDSSRDGRQR